MLLDKRTEFCDAVALNTGAAGTYNVGNTVDTRSATTDPNVLKDLGASDDLFLVVRMVTAATSGGAATLQMKLVSDDADPPNTATASQHGSSPVLALAALVAGATVWVTKLPSSLYERYVGIQQVTAVAAFTGGTFDAFLTNDANLWRAYADNVA